MPNPFEQGQARGEIIQGEQPRKQEEELPKVIVEEGVMKEEMSNEELRAREEEAADLLREDISQKKFELNQKVRIKGEQEEWYYLGEDERRVLLGNWPETSDTKNYAKIWKRVKPEDLEKV